MIGVDVFMVKKGKVRKKQKQKNSKKWVVGGFVILLVIAAYFLVNNVFSLVQFEDYLTFDDFGEDSDIVWVSNIVVSDSGRQSGFFESDDYIVRQGISSWSSFDGFGVESGEFYLFSYLKSAGSKGNDVFEPVLEIKEDFRGKDVVLKVRTVNSGENVRSGFTVYSPVGAYSSSGNGDSVIELRSDDLDSDHVALFVNSIKRAEGVLSGSDSVVLKIKPNNPYPLLFGTSGAAYNRLFIDFIKYKIPFSCKLEYSDSVLAMETVSGGASVDIVGRGTQLREWDDFSRFCLELPTIRTKEGGADTTADTYIRLIKGDSVNVPEGQSYTFFYIFRDEDAVFDRCEFQNREVLNLNTGSCDSLVLFGAREAELEETIRELEGDVVKQAEVIESYVDALALEKKISGDLQSKIDAQAKIIVSLKLDAEAESLLISELAGSSGDEADLVLAVADRKQQNDNVKLFSYVGGGVLLFLILFVFRKGKRGKR